MTATEKGKILVVGSYNVGMVVNTYRLPVWGETLIGNGFTEGPGGKGSNQAVAAARLGGEVCFVGCVGEDRYGDDAIRMLESEYVDISYLKRTNKSKTGIGFIFLNEHGENSIIVDSGANLRLQPNDPSIPLSIDKADIVLVQLENDINTIEETIKISKEKGKTVILNPAPAQNDINSLLSYVTILTPNESELKILAGLEPSISINHETCIEIAKELLQKGPETIVVTLGEHGALIVNADGHKFVSAPRVKPKDTTGAGDSFNGALAVALSEQKKIEEAVQWACYAGAYTVIGSEVIPSLPTRKQLEAFIDNKTTSYQA
ncbi:ribokinase [Peribacillus butanolivorans]|uniref:ribokinase n=1 Tax=Peribacillus butanolivorans TaxID=421767 RepID=UPI0037C79C77